MRERLLTAVRPRLDVKPIWIDPTPDTWVLAIHVERGGTDAHFIERVNETFVRRGATNRRASPEDIRRMQLDRERATRAGMARLSSQGVMRPPL